MKKIWFFAEATMLNKSHQIDNSIDIFKVFTIVISCGNQNKSKMSQKEPKIITTTTAVAATTTTTTTTRTLNMHCMTLVFFRFVHGTYWEHIIIRNISNEQIVVCNQNNNILLCSQQM